MLLEVLKSKISYAKVTQKDLFYEGSITIDEEVMRKAKLQAYEKVHVVNLNNGERFETYVIKGKAGTKIIGLNGPAARLGEVGDDVFIMSYVAIDPAKEKIEPVVVDLRKE